jgi:hypothetical protein
MGQDKFRRICLPAFSTPFMHDILSCVHSHIIQPWPSSTRIEPKEAKFRTRSNNSKVQGAKMMIELLSMTTYDPDSTAH